jgi:hypothetical protein
MTDKQVGTQSPITLFSLMESLTPMPVSDKFRGKDFTILLIVEDREKAKYEMLIRNQKLEILKGDPHKPDISIEGFEEDFIKVFQKMDNYNYAVLKVRGPILKHVTLTTFIGEINLFLEKRNQPVHEINETDGQKEIPEAANSFVPKLPNAKASEVWSDTLTSIRINYFNEPPESHTFLSSTLEKLSKKILSDAYLNNMSTGGMSANTYSAAIKKVVMPEIQALKEDFFERKAKNGALGGFEKFHLETQNKLSLGDTSARFSDLVAIYAECIAAVSKKQVTLETFEDAYTFFLSDLQRYIAETMSVKFKESEKIQDFTLIAPSNNRGFERFMIVTNLRLAVTAERKIVEEVALNENETRPQKIAQEDTTLFLQTNHRVIWFLPTFLKYKLLVGETGETNLIRQTKYLEKSRLFLGANGMDLFVWTDEKPMRKIALASVQRFEIVVREMEKKVIFMTQKIKQPMLLLYCPDELGVDISEKDHESVREFLTGEVKITEKP